MSNLDVPDGMALRCRVCHWIPGDDVTVGVLQAHFQTEHPDNPEILLDLVVLCPRCALSMTYEGSLGRADLFVCGKCHRTRTIRREHE